MFPTPPDNAHGEYLRILERRNLSDSQSLEDKGQSGFTKKSVSGESDDTHRMTFMFPAILTFSDSGWSGRPIHRAERHTRNSVSRQGLQVNLVAWPQPGETAFSCRSVGDDAAIITGNRVSRIIGISRPRVLLTWLIL